MDRREVGLALDRRSSERADRLVAVERYPLLICDDVGYIPFDPHAANLMFMLVSRRYECPSLIVPSNKPFSTWGEIFGDDAIAAAMIDRLVHHAEIRDPLAEGRQLSPEEPRPRCTAR